VHLVGYAIEIYYDARPYEHQICSVNNTATHSERLIIICLLKCINETIQVTKGHRYFSRGQHVG